MGGSAKKVRDEVATRSGYTGSDLDKGAQAVGQKGAEGAEYLKDKGRGIAAGADNMAQGFSKGMQGLGDTVMGGLQHNLGEFAKIIHGGGGGGEEGSQEATASYSGSSKKGKAAGSAEGRMGKNRERLAKRDALKVRK